MINYYLYFVITKMLISKSRGFFSWCTVSRKKKVKYEWPTLGLQMGNTSRQMNHEKYVYVFLQSKNVNNESVT